MSDVVMQLPPSHRGKMATKLLEAAEELGLSPSVVRTQYEGFRVPAELHQHLFPSLYNEDGTAVGSGPEDDPADDFGDLTPEELEELTSPDTKD